MDRVGTLICLNSHVHLWRQFGGSNFRRARYFRCANQLYFLRTSRQEAYVILFHLVQYNVQFPYEVENYAP